MEVAYMLKLNSITFLDDSNGKVVNVYLPDLFVNSNDICTFDEYFYCKLQAERLVKNSLTQLHLSKKQ